MLIARAQIQPDELERALELQKERGDKLGKILVDMGFLAARDVLAALSRNSWAFPRPRSIPRPRNLLSWTGFRPASCARPSSFP